MDYPKLIEFQQVRFCPMLFDVGSSKRRRQRAQKQGNRQHGG